MLRKVLSVRSLPTTALRRYVPNCVEVKCKEASGCPDCQQSSQRGGCCDVIAPRFQVSVTVSLLIARVLALLALLQVQGKGNAHRCASCDAHILSPLTGDRAISNRTFDRLWIQRLLLHRRHPQAGPR